MKGKGCFNPPALFWFKIKGNVKYPPDTHTDIHSIYPLLHPLNGLTEAMQRDEEAERETERKRERKLVLGIGKGKKELNVWEREQISLVALKNTEEFTQ